MARGGGGWGGRSEGGSLRARNVGCSTRTPQWRKLNNRLTRVGVSQKKKKKKKKRRRKKKKRKKKAAFVTNCLRLLFILGGAPIV